MNSIYPATAEHFGQQFLDRELLGEVRQAILVSTNWVSPYKSGLPTRSGKPLSKGPFFDPGFTYRLKQSLDVYWEDDTWDQCEHYQQAEDFIQSACEIHQGICSVSNKRSETRFEIFRRVSRAKEILDCEDYVHFNLDMLARESIMSKFCLVRSFKQIHQVTPQKYFTHRKMKTAMILLHQGTPVRIVAEKMGYPDVFSFSKQFKKYTGFSPGKVRKQNG